MNLTFIVLTQPRSGNDIMVSKLRSHPNIYIALGNPVQEYLCERESYNDITEYMQYKFDIQNYNLKYEEQEIVYSLNTRDHMEMVHNEYFETASSTHKEKETVVSFLNKVYSKNREDRKAGYLDATAFTLSQYRTFGMVMYIEDFLNSKSDIKYDLPELVRKQNIKVILLTRDNLLWRYVSSQLKTTINSQGYSKIITETCNIDSNDLNYDIRKCETEQHTVHEFLLQNNIPYHTVTYEQMCDSTFDTFVNIQKFLNVPVNKTDLHGINTLNIFEETRPLSVIVNNYEQLKADNNNNNNVVKAFFQNAETRVNPLYYKLRERGTAENLQFIKEMYRNEFLKMYKNTPVGDSLKKTNFTLK